MFLFGDRGTPDGFRRMHGFSSHTYKFVNAAGQAFWTKLHYRTRAGEKNLSAAEAARLEGADPDYATRDLFEHIAAGKTAEWDVEAQFIPLADGEKYKFNIFDLTKTVSQKDYPRVRIGKMVLNRNPQNYFAEVEQVGGGPRGAAAEESDREGPAAGDRCPAPLLIFFLCCVLWLVIRPPSLRRTWCPASSRRRTACCRLVCSATRTRTGTDWAPTICRSRSTAPTPAA